MYIEEFQEYSNQNNKFFNSKKKKDPGRALNLWCFNSGVAMKELNSSGLRSLILTSGTLSPLDSFAFELQTYLPPPSFSLPLSFALPPFPFSRFFDHFPWPVLLYSIPLLSFFHYPSNLLLPFITNWTMLLFGLSIHQNREFPIQLENPHVIDGSQIWVGVSSCGPSGHAVNTSFQHRNKDTYIQELGNSIGELHYTPLSFAIPNTNKGRGNTNQ